MSVEQITQTRYFSGESCSIVVGRPGEGHEEQDAIKLPKTFVAMCLEGKSKPVPHHLRHFIDYSGCDCGPSIVILIELAEWFCDDTNFESTWKTYTDKEFIAFG